jgi:RNA polymerase sigma-70 factor (ECF subfamily)
MEDLELMRRIAANDSAALKTLVDRFQVIVLNLCTRLLGTRQNAEDAAQEVFFQVYKSAASVRGDCLVSTWIYRITVNRCRNFSRDNKKYQGVNAIPRVLQDELRDGESPRHSPDPESAWLEEELKKFTRQAVASLPEKQKTMLILHQYEGYSYKEIAEILDVSLSSVESGLHRAKINLQKKLSPRVCEFLRGRKL